MANTELTKRVYVRQLKEKLNLNQVSGDDHSLDRWIIAPDVNRPGLELTGYVDTGNLKRVVIIGNKESDYLETLDVKTQEERFEVLTDSYTPCIIWSSHAECSKILLDVTKRKNFPVFDYRGETYRVSVDVVSYLAEELAPVDTVHGVMMNVYGIGVMLIGQSGIGKSELALDLIKRGHMLVADDRVDVARVGDDIVTKAPNILAKYLEIRGLGVVDVTMMFGGFSYLEKCNLDFIIKLVKYDENKEMDRLNPVSATENILGVDVPELEVPVTEGKSLSVIIETAVTDYILKKRGIDCNEEFKDRVMQMIIDKNEGVYHD